MLRIRHAIPGTYTGLPAARKSTELMRRIRRHRLANRRCACVRKRKGAGQEEGREVYVFDKERTGARDGKDADTCELKRRGGGAEERSNEETVTRCALSRRCVLIKYSKDVRHGEVRNLFQAPAVPVQFVRATTLRVFDFAVHQMLEPTLCTHRM
eukprot:3817970-Rhodomonas_salina.1